MISIGEKPDRLRQVGHGKKAQPARRTLRDLQEAKKRTDDAEGDHREAEQAPLAVAEQNRAEEDGKRRQQCHDAEPRRVRRNADRQPRQTLAQALKGRDQRRPMRQQRPSAGGSGTSWISGTSTTATQKMNSQCSCRTLARWRQNRSSSRDADHNSNGMASNCSSASDRKPPRVPPPNSNAAKSVNAVSQNGPLNAMSLNCSEASSTSLMRGTRMAISRIDIPIARLPVRIMTSRPALPLLA